MGNFAHLMGQCTTKLGEFKAHIGKTPDEIWACERHVSCILYWDA